MLGSVANSSFGDLLKRLKQSKEGGGGSQEEEEGDSPPARRPDSSSRDGYKRHDDRIESGADKASREVANFTQ